MSDVFISYAREDQAFVRRLHGALSAKGSEAWVDWEGIPASAKWMSEVRAAIDGSDAFVFVISPDSVESPVCREEIAHAAAGNKRIVPLVHRDVPEGLVPETVAAHNWIEFRDQDDFDRAFGVLVEAIRTDPEWVRTHTRLLLRAKEWEQSGGDRSFLLRGGDLAQAEAWLGDAGGKEPSPTTAHATYLLASHRAASRRQRTLALAVAGAMVFALLLSAFALLQRSRAVQQKGRAEQQQSLAEQRARVATSREIASEALSQLQTDPQLSLLLSAQAVGSAATLEAEDALRQSLERSLVRAQFTASSGGSALTGGTS